jgi:hypothetical protein
MANSIANFLYDVGIPLVKRRSPVAAPENLHVELYKEVISTYAVYLPGEVRGQLADPATSICNLLVHSDASLAELCSFTLQHIVFSMPAQRPVILQVSHCTPLTATTVSRSSMALSCGCLALVNIGFGDFGIRIQRYQQSLFTYVHYTNYVDA